MGTSAADGDIYIDEFVRVLRSLALHLPISDRFERDQPQLRGSWWTSQQEHMISWFGGQNSLGSGAFSRSAPNISARTTYNRLLSPPAFVWMAEALGEDVALVQAAADAARAEPNARKRPGLLRQPLPWERIEALARAAYETASMTGPKRDWRISQSIRFFCKARPALNCPIESAIAHMMLLTIRQHRKNGEVDLIFEAKPEQAFLDDFHDTLRTSIDGASTKNGIRDEIVTARQRDFDDVVRGLVSYFRAIGFTVAVE